MAERLFFSNIHIGIAYILLGFCAFYWWKSSSPSSGVEPKWMLRIYLVKISSMLAFSLVYVFYYGGGDTFNYFQDANILWQVFLNSPSNYLKLLFMPAGKYSLDILETMPSLMFLKGNAEWTMVKVTSVFTILSFGSYLGASVLFSIASIWGGWKLFSFFTSILPKQTTLLFIGIFLMPSCLFWTSGILKDTICLTLVSLVVYYYDQYLTKENHRVKSVIFAIGCLALLYLIKYYIAVCLLLAIVFWTYWQYDRRSTAALTKILLRTTMALLLVAFMAQTKSVLEEMEKSALFDASVQKMKGYHSLHSENQFSYTLEVNNYSTIELASKVPEAVFITVFRPFIWEAKTFPQLLSAIENAFISILVLYAIAVFYKNLISGKRMAISPIILCSTFICSLAFIVGVFSYNFGLLVRLKTPLLPFLVAMTACMIYAPTPQPVAYNLSDD